MKYLVRSLKYFVVLCVIFAATLSVMFLTGTSAMSPEDTIYAMLHTDRYIWFYGFIVLVSAIYPKTGFMKRRVTADILTDREKIIEAFRTEGFRLTAEKEGVMTFRGAGLLKKLRLLFEDDMYVWQQDEQIVIDGLRRSVVRVVDSLASSLHNEDNE